MLKFVAGFTPLHLAIMQSNVRLCRTLAAASASIPTRSEILEMTMNGTAPEADPDRTDFFCWVDEVCSHGEDAQRQAKVLFQSVRDNPLFLARILQDQTVSIVNHPCDESGNRALHLACVLNCESSIKDLLENGADPNIKNSAGETPLHCLCSSGHALHTDELVSVRTLFEKYSILIIHSNDSIVFNYFHLFPCSSH